MNSTDASSEATAALAVNGGSKVRNAPWPTRMLFGEEEKAAVMSLFDRAIAEGSQVLGYNGPEEEAYTKAFVEWMGGGYADAVNSGTNAVLVAVRALELEPGSEVIVPPITDPGGVMPVVLAGLIPVPADSVPGSFNTSAEQIAARITERTRAIMVAHISGMPVDMDPVLELAKKHGLPVIEDVAQSHGAKYKGRMCGTMGTIAAFSTMFGKQHASGGQGGLVYTRDEEVYWRIRRHSDRGKPFGKDLGTGAGVGVGVAASKGNNLIAAGNHNMDEIHAAIGKVQIKRLPGFIEQRRKVARGVAEGIASLKTVGLEWNPPCAGCPNRATGTPGEACESGCEGSFWFLMFHWRAEACTVDKQTYLEALAGEGVGVSPTYFFVPVRQPWALQEAFVSPVTGKPADPHPGAIPLPNAEATDASHFVLNIHEGFGEEEVRDIVAALEKVDRAFAR